MSPSLTADALAVLSGLLVGMLSGLIGVGGGVLLVPIMVLGFGFGQHLAQGTSLAAIIPSSLVGAVTHYRQGSLELRGALLMGGTGALLAVPFGLLALSLDPGVLARLFGLLLIFAGFRMWPRRPRRQPR